LVARGRLPLDQVLGILLGVAQALAFIHDRGMVHRDLKPANLRLQPDGVVTLMDFGLAGPTGLRPRGITGTPAYMAPEAIRGEAVGPACDLYALGCLAYELVTGVVPFDGEPRAVLAAHLRERPLPLTAFRPEVPLPLEALVASLLAKEPAERPGGADDVLRALAELAGVAAAQPTASQAHSYLVASRLVGRDAELRILQEAWARARGGEGQAVLVAAAGGLGKSRLVAAQLLDCELDSAVVARVSCVEAGAGPFDALKGAVRALAAGLGPPPAPLAALIDGHPHEGRPQDPAHLGRALASWLADAGPVAWVLEDLHHADHGTMAAFCACARSLDRAHALLLGTVRPDEVAESHPSWGLAAEGTATLVTLRPLDLGAFEALLAATVGPQAPPRSVVEALFAATAGSPFALEVVLRDLLERDLLVRHLGAWCFPPADALALPTSAAEAILRRLDRMPEIARRLAGMAAVLGGAPTREGLLALSGAAEADCFHALDALARAGLLVPERDALRFVHDRLREAIYAAQPDDVRRAWHGACAGFLARAGGAPAELAHHHEAAGDPEQAWRAYMRAAEASEAAGLPLAAFEQRVRAESCLVSAGSGDDAVLARVRWQAGLVGSTARPQDAAPLLERLVAQLQGSVLGGENLPTPLEARLALTAAHGFAGRPARAAAVAADAARWLAGPDDPWRASWLTVRCAGWLAAGHVDAIRAALVQARALLPCVDVAQLPPLLQRARMATWAYENARVYQGHPPDDGMEAEAVGLAERLGAQGSGAVIRHYRGIWLASAGRGAELEAFLASEEARAKALGGTPHASVPYLRACAAWLRGEHRAGLALVRRARELGAAIEPIASYMAVLEARLLAASGEPERGLALVAETAARAAQAGLELAQAIALTALGELAAAQGDHARATSALREARALTGAGAAARNPGCEAMAQRLLGEVALREGRLDEARARLADAEACLASPGLDLALERGELARALGAVAVAAGDASQARDALTEAARRFREVGSLAGLHAVHQARRSLAPMAAEAQDDWGDLEAWLVTEGAAFPEGADAVP
jgi:hypothetical protein